MRVCAVAKGVITAFAVLIAASCVLYAVQAQGAEINCPNSRSLESITAQLAADGGDILYLLDLNGDGFDQMLVLEVGGMIQHMGFFEGCAISDAYPLGPVRPEEPGA